MARIFCIGRNYSEHAKELGNEVPGSPVIFMKPWTCLVRPGWDVRMPKHGSDLHFETELVLEIGRAGRPESEADAAAYVGGLTVGFDLTLRDVQDRLKAQGKPWELAKAFDDSAPCGVVRRFAPGTVDLDAVKFTGRVNGVLRQEGDSGQMIFPISRLLVELGRVWRLMPGDQVFTGTPAGVGPVSAGDEIEAESGLPGVFRWRIVDA